MVTIELLEGHRISSGDKQWTFEKRSKEPNKKDKNGNLTGEYTYSPIGYYGTIDGAVWGAYKYFQRRLDADGVTDFMIESRRLLDSFTAILSPKFSVVENGK